MSDFTYDKTEEILLASDVFYALGKSGKHGMPVETALRVLADVSAQLCVYGWTPAQGEAIKADLGETVKRREVVVSELHECITTYREKP